MRIVTLWVQQIWKPLKPFSVTIPTLDVFDDL